MMKEAIIWQQKIQRLNMYSHFGIKYRGKTYSVERSQEATTESAEIQSKYIPY